MYKHTSYLGIHGGQQKLLEQLGRRSTVSTPTYLGRYLGTCTLKYRQVASPARYPHKHRTDLDSYAGKPFRPVRPQTSTNSRPIRPNSHHGRASASATTPHSLHFFQRSAAPGETNGSYEIIIFDLPFTIDILRCTARQDGTAHDTTCHMIFHPPRSHPITQIQTVDPRSQEYHHHLTWSSQSPL